MGAKREKTVKKMSERGRCMYVCFVGDSEERGGAHFIHDAAQINSKRS